MLKKIFCASLLILLVPIEAFSGHIRVATASNFLVPLKILGQVYEKETGHRVSISSGSTGKLYAQIRQGAPYDIFLAADSLSPQRLEAENVILPKSRFIYAKGQLALWSKKKPLDGLNLASQLCNKQYKFIALANPKHAPYGRASMEALESLPCWQDYQTQIVTSENLGQAFQYVASGAADIGFVSFSQLKGLTSRHEYHIVEPQYYQPIIQEGVILKNSKAPDVANHFKAFLLSSEVQKMLLDYGYLPNGI